MSPDSSDTNRRRFLKAVGTATLTVSVAGCAGDDDGDDGSDGGGDDGGMDDDGDDGTGDDGTGDDDSDGGENILLTYARGNSSGSLDPQSTPSGEDIKVANQIFDTLLRFRPGTAEVVAGLATEWNLDGTDVSLTLREGVTFHNGDEFTAEDFVASYRRYVDRNYEYFAGEDYTSSYGDLSLGGIDSVEAMGDYELSMTLKQPSAPFISWLATFNTSVIPESVIEEMGSDQDQFSQEPVGSGPFQFDSWDTGNQRIRLTAHDDWWGEGPNVDEVVFTAITENSTRAQTLDTGDADIIDGIGAQAMQIVENSGNAELLSVPGMNTGYMGLNLVNVPEFRDKRVRQAINYAVNTEAIVDTIFGGIAVQSSQPIPSNIPGYNEDLDPYPYDPEEAQRLLDEAGISDLSFELSTFQNPRAYIPSPIQAAETIKSNLADVGVDVTINQMEFNAFLTYTISDNNHEAFFLGNMSDNGDPDNFYFQLLHPGIPADDVPEGQNYVSAETVLNSPTFAIGHWAHREYMEIVSEARTVYDQESRAQMYRDAAEIAYEEAPWLFLSHAKELAGVHDRVSNFQLSGGPGGPALHLVQKDG